MSIAPLVCQCERRARACCRHTRFAAQKQHKWTSSWKRETAFSRPPARSPRFQVCGTPNKRLFQKRESHIFLFLGSSEMLSHKLVFFYSPSPRWEQLGTSLPPLLVNNCKFDIVILMPQGPKRSERKTESAGFSHMTGWVELAFYQWNVMTSLNLIVVEKIINSLVSKNESSLIRLIRLWASLECSLLIFVDLGLWGANETNTGCVID